ncbi:hypothetical protein FisN_3Lh357 [Fistulifera solaris]|uniref:Uncharacterized protein n=1 Tax=Fistulifera solaris TaxID=1519565 RepID=A0A1Z5J8R0_FISSO|nr:hypothetical protein FisN_3Lh357 [Fistulifera solaris]|eukprot:GAX10161.1 hypothetical protein FisN_3Lh357 [Fistulifera solaris]
MSFIFRVFRKRWKRAPKKAPKVSIQEPPEVSSTASDMFPDCDFDVAFRVSSDADINSFHQSMEHISLQESSLSSDPYGGSSTSSLGTSKKVKFFVSEIDLLPLLNESRWLEVKRQLRRLQKHGSSQDICRVLTRRNDSEGESILHIAAWKAPPGLFHMMVSMLPEVDRTTCLSLEDKDGNTPFHLLCANLNGDCVDFSIVEDTLMRDIGILCKPNSYGDTCLHLLIASDAFSMTQAEECKEVAAIEKLSEGVFTKVGTEALLSCKNVKGLNLLHIAIANQVHGGVLSQLLRLAPACAKDADNRGMLPLHYTAGASFIAASFVEELIQVYPDSIMQQDKNGDTSLHLQLVNITRRQNANDDQNMIQVIEFLMGEKQQLGHGDESVSSPMLIQNREGLTPLHVCALFGVPSELTKILMGSSFVDDSFGLKTNDGSSALHLACRSEHISELADLIEFLSSKKGACSIADNEGLTPLINAVQNPDVSVEVVKILCHAYPEGLTISKNGMIVLHQALSMGPNANAGVVKALLKAAPKTINVAWKGNSVLTEALKCGVPKSVVKVLMEKLNYKKAKKSKRTKRASTTTTSRC